MRTAFSVTVALFVLISFSALAEDDGCVAAPPTAPLKTKLPKGMTLLESTIKDRTAEQHLRLADGTVLTLRVGGCAHIAYSVELPVKNLDVRKATAFFLKTLKTLPLEEGPSGMNDSLIRALAAPKGSKSPVQLPCGDAHCQLELTEEVARVSYDFAL